jgi:GNAT superfamily N-acetyltransferase
MFILKEYRRKGVSVELLKAVGEFVRKKGGKIVEGYPVIPYSDSIPAAFAWTGTLQSYKRAGFRLAGQHSKARPIMRIII